MSTPPKRTTNRLADTSKLTDAELVAIFMRREGLGNERARAEKLLLQVGTLDDLKRMSYNSLVQTLALSTSEAARLVAAFELGIRRSVVANVQITPDRAWALIREIELLEQEEFWVLHLDSKAKFISKEMVYRGTTNGIMMMPRDVFRTATRIGSALIILAHNHPSGDPVPSPQDIDATNRMIESGRIVDILVADHLVIGKGCYVSMRQKNLCCF